MTDFYELEEYSADYKEDLKKLFSPKLDFS